MPLNPRLKENKKVLLLGSGALSIGQAGEFDYSGTQALRSLEEEGLEVIVVNPNIATVQTDPKENRKIYLYPINAHWVEKVIEKERPAGIIANCGGQTAINCILELDEKGVLEKYNICNLGTPLPTFNLTEDRELFANFMTDFKIPVVPSIAATTLEKALSAAKEIGFPLLVRSAFALGGLGSGVVHSEEELKKLATKALSSSSQILLEKSLFGWKEVEYEVMRDGEGNAITICNMENFDPLGVHTGDSIVICPSQTLTDEEYQLLRSTSLNIVNHLKIVGECNVQFALDPFSKAFYVIEVNARLSRSSALASKASGYPIAYLSTKVSIGYNLLELKNPVTKTTSALFEPSLDYVALKLPKWDLKKFVGVSDCLGTTMKSVGEIMAIGRSFKEVVQKALRMVHENEHIFSLDHTYSNTNNILEDIATPTVDRILKIFEAFRRGHSLEDVSNSSFIDKWFLCEISDLTKIEKSISNSALGKAFKSNAEYQVFLKSINKETLKKWKQAGFSDLQIVNLQTQKAPYYDDHIDLGSFRNALRNYRKQLEVFPFAKKIDTTAGEFLAPSNYIYFTYFGEESDVEFFRDEKSYLLLGGGAYRIGSSVEFDWCAVTCSEAIRQENIKSIIINCNPETVSTDFNAADRLYFEELTLERILDISDYENFNGAIVCMGGQLPNCLAETLNKNGLPIIGHSIESIRRAEGRVVFSNILRGLEVDQPEFISANDIHEVDNFLKSIGFPILVRPSFVLSGTSMKVAHNRAQLEDFLVKAGKVSKSHPVLLTKFIEGAKEVELDGVAKKGEVVIAIFSEHLEKAGVHSGDATIVYPTQTIEPHQLKKAKDYGSKIVRSLNLNGPFNIQFLVKGDQVKVIECNARASRSFPFVSKVSGVNLAKIATKILLGTSFSSNDITIKNKERVGVKSPMFSFNRLDGVDPKLRVEMSSTGEVGCISESLENSLLLSTESVGLKKPKKGILIISEGQEGNPLTRKIIDKSFHLGLPVTTNFKIKKDFLNNAEFEEVEENKDQLDKLSKDLENKKIDLVINLIGKDLPKKFNFGKEIRKIAIKYNCPLITNTELASAFLNGVYLNSSSKKSEGVHYLQ